MLLVLGLAYLNVAREVVTVQRAVAVGIAASATVAVRRWHRTR